VGTAKDCDAEELHLPGARTTAREFIERVYARAGAKPRATAVPHWVLSVAGTFDATLRGAADIGHLWADPILLDGARYRARFGEVPLTALDTAIETTFAWHRARPALRLQG
jgi:hypothetical protein